MINKLKQTLTINNLSLLFIVSLILVPILDLDLYFLFPILRDTPIPLPSTVLYLVWFPLLTLITFVLYDKNKKRTFIFTIAYGLCILTYFIMHNKIAIELLPRLYLTKNFEYSLFKEAVYVCRLMFPFLITYMTVIIKPSKKHLKILVVSLTSVIALPILISNIFAFGQSTYVGYTPVNFLHWFTDAYKNYEPRELATKFFFTEGNTTGILMFMLVPALTYFLKESKNKERIGLTLLLISLGLAMIIIGTRVATYGFAICMITTLMCSLVLLLFKKMRLDVPFLAIIAMLALSFTLVLPYTPAVENQTIDMATGEATNNNDTINSGRQELTNKIGDLVPGSVDYDYALQYMFLQYRNMLTTPDVYYEMYYHYTFDSKFWVDLIFEVPFEDRINGRQFERIFFDYKYANLTPYEKLFGFGYSTFMNGSILLEQDFTMQIYTMGYIGFILLCLPWFILLAYVGIKVLFNLKSLLNFEILMFGMAFCCGLVGAYMSGHVLDQYFTSYFMGFLSGALMISVNKKGATNEQIK